MGRGYDSVESGTFDNDDVGFLARQDHPLLVGQEGNAIGRYKRVFIKHQGIRQVGYNKRRFWLALRGWLACDRSSGNIPVWLGAPSVLGWSDMAQGFTCTVWDGWPTTAVLAEFFDEFLWLRL